MSDVKITNPLLHKERIVKDPPVAKNLFNSVYAALLWLPIRIWVGYQWLEAGLAKVSNPAWVGGGTALKGFWTGAIAVPATGRPAIAFAWYRSFLQFLLDAQAYTWFAKVIAYSELVVGVALIIGAFTGIAAFAGGIMNWNYIMAGSASTNGLMFALAVGLILAWKVAGYIGADYFLLPLIGTPWGREKKAAAAPSGATEPASSDR